MIQLPRLILICIIIFHSDQVTELTKGGGNVTRKGKDSIDDQKVLQFYNLASGKLLTGLEVSNKYDDSFLRKDKKYNINLVHSEHNELVICVSFCRKILETLNRRPIGKY